MEGMKRHTAGAHDGRHPLVEVVALRSCSAIRGQLKADLREFLQNPLRWSCEGRGEHPWPSFSPYPRPGGGTVTHPPLFASPLLSSPLRFPPPRPSLSLSPPQKPPTKTNIKFSLQCKYTRSASFKAHYDTFPSIPYITILTCKQ